VFGLVLVALRFRKDRSFTVAWSLSPTCEKKEEPIVEVQVLRRFNVQNTYLFRGTAWCANNIRPFSYELSL